MDRIRFGGSITAIITPFRGGAIDVTAFDRLIEWQIGQGTTGIVACGTTGESPVLTLEEHHKVIERTIAVVKSRIPVIAGTGSNSTAKTIELTTHARHAGADAALIVTPYYNKPTQDGLYAHYSAIATAVPDLPIIMYNIPGRSVIDMKNETVARLARDHKNIVGLKDATADLARPQKIKQLIGPEFIQLSGEDATVYDYLEQGGHGCISVTSNIAPALCAQLHQAWQRGDKAAAKTINDRLMPLHKALFVETSPAPVKYALSRLGFCTDELRLPLVPASAAARQAVDDALTAVGIDLKAAA